MSEEGDEDLGERWKKFKAENWERTNYSNKFQPCIGWSISVFTRTYHTVNQLTIPLYPFQAYLSWYATNN